MTQPTPPEIAPRNERRITKTGLALGLAIGAVVGAAGVGVTAVAGGFDGVIRSALRSDDPYQQLSWRDVPIKTPIDWPYRFSADESLSGAEAKSPGSWHKVGILSVNAAALDQRRIETDCDQAVAYPISAGVASVGTMPAGNSFLGSKQGDAGRYTVGMRIGKGELLAAIGLYCSETDEFIAFPAGGTVAETTTLDKIKQDYPGVVVV